jgi:hypothetical protein
VRNVNGWALALGVCHPHARVPREGSRVPGFLARQTPSPRLSRNQAGEGQARAGMTHREPSSKSMISSTNFKLAALKPTLPFLEIPGYYSVLMRFALIDSPDEMSPR